jgi:hypothetical protein
MEKQSVNLLKSLIESDIAENQILGSLLLKSKNIPEEEREIYIKQILEKYLHSSSSVDKDVMNNVIEAYSNLSSVNTLKNRVKKL